MKPRYLAVLAASLLVVSAGTAAEGSARLSSATTASVQASETKTVGFTEIGATWSAPAAAGFRWGNVVTLTERGAITSISAYLKGTDATPGKQRAVIYSALNGRPAGAALAASRELLVPASAPPAWYELSFVSPITLDPGEYLIGLWSGSSNVQFAYGGGATNFWNGESYSATTLPAGNAWNGATTQMRFSLYATYDAAGGGGTPPQNVAPPTISGEAVVGRTLTASPGSWSGDPAPSFAYEWRRCDTADTGCAAVAGAAGASYTLAAADEGRTVRVAVTGSNSAGSATAVSAATGVVQAGPQSADGSFGRAVFNNMYGLSADRKRASRFVAPASGSLVALSAYLDGLGGGAGSQQVRFVVFADAGGSPGPLLGQTGVHTIAQGAAGAWVRLGLANPVSVTGGSGYFIGNHSGLTQNVARFGSQAGVAGATRENGDAFADGASSQFGVFETYNFEVAVQAHYTASTSTPPANTTPPSITGTPQVGATLNASTGSWSGNPPPTFAFEWRRCDAGGGTCVAVAGAAGASYALVAADEGKTVRVAVTGSNSAGSATAVSAQTAIVQAPVTAPANTSLPSITGVPQVGATLHASTGSWSGNPSPTFTYEWRRCDPAGAGCVTVAGASETSYTLVAADEGRTVRIAVTGSNSAGSATAVSAATGVVQPASEPPPESSFGRTVFNNLYVLAADRKRASRFFAPASGSLVALSAYLDGLGGSAGSQQVRLAVYADAGGAPGALLGQTGAHTIAAGTAGAWVRLALVSPVAVTGASAYHLGIHSAATNAVGRYGNMLGLSVANNRQNDDVFSDGAANPFGAVVANYNFEVAVQAHYTTAGGDAPPQNAAPPTIGGDPIVGRTLMAGTGSWSGAPPPTYSYQWRRCDSGGGNCVSIIPATGSTYTLVTGDQGSTIRVAVTATNTAGSATATSAATAVVQAPTGGPGVVGFQRIVVDPATGDGTLEKGIADINGDGRKDLIVGGRSRGVWWYQQPDAGPNGGAWVRRSIVSSGSAYEGMQTADISGDGRHDIVLSLDGRLVWLQNPGGAGTGVWGQHLIATGTVHDLHLNDLDGDGKLDVVASRTRNISFQNTSTSWTLVPWGGGAGTGQDGLALLDIGSGRGNVNIVGATSTGIYWFENPIETGGNARAAASWSPRRIADNTFDGPSIATLDVNGDGRQDVVMAPNEGNFAKGGGLVWFEAPADRRLGTWVRRTIDSDWQAVHWIEPADINGDGKSDLVVTEQEQSHDPLNGPYTFNNDKVAVFYSDGAGSFTRQVLETTGGQNQVAADIDADGDVDFFFANHGFYGAPNPVVLFVNLRR